MKNIFPAKISEKHLAEDIWLNYLNTYLYKSGTISEKEYKEMTVRISALNTEADGKRAAT